MVEKIFSRPFLFLIFFNNLYTSTKYVPLYIEILSVNLTLFIFFILANLILFLNKTFKTMKSLTQFIVESMINGNLSKYEKCKVFKNLFKLYTGCNKPEDLTEDDFDIYDLGFAFNRNNISYIDFVKWLKSVWNEKVNDVKTKDLGNAYNVTFKMKGEEFDLDVVKED